MTADEKWHKVIDILERDEDVTNTPRNYTKEERQEIIRCKKQVFDQQFSEKLDSADFGKLVLHIVIDKAVMRQRAAASLLGA